MICPKCGSLQPDNGKFCTECGAPLSPVQAQVQEQVKPVVQPEPYVQPAAPAPEQLPKAPTQINDEPAMQIQQNIGRKAANLKEYVTLYGDEKTQKSMKTVSIALYILAALNFIFAFINGAFPIDAIILLVLGILYQRTYSTTCAYVLLGYSILTVVAGLLATGRFTGWLILVIGITAAMTNRTVQKSYDAYKNGGQPMV